MDRDHKLNALDFTQQPWQKWDQENEQVFVPEQVTFVTADFCKIKAEKASDTKIQKLWDAFLEDCNTWEKQRRVMPWKYVSGALTSRKRIDIFSPGRIKVRCEMVHGDVNPSVWIFDEWHGSHGNDPLGRGGDEYFEMDVFESGPNRIQKKQCVFFSKHIGKSSWNKRMHNDIVRGDYSARVHDYELHWDGEGNFYWVMDGVLVFKRKEKIHPDTAPRILITLGVTRDIPRDVTWRIEELLFDGKWKR